MQYIIILTRGLTVERKKDISQEQPRRVQCKSADHMQFATICTLIFVLIKLKYLIEKSNAKMVKIILEKS